MRLTFQLLAAGGIAYLATLIAVLDTKVRRRLYPQLDMKRWAEKLHSDSIQTILHNAGIMISAKQFNLFRLLLSVALLILGYVPSILTLNKPSLLPIIFVLLLWFTTSPRPMTLGWFIYTGLKKRRDRRKNRELIALVRLYEQNKRNQNLKLDVFLKHVASNFHLLRRELITLSERITDDGLESAIQWFSQLFPGHPFAGQICTIILTTESLPTNDAVDYLEQESHTIAKISSSLYLERWNTISTVATMVNAIPSVMMFFLVITLVLYHILRVKSTLFF